MNKAHKSIREIILFSRILLQATFFFSFFINIFGPCALKTLANTFVWLALASNLSFAKALPVHHKFTNKFMETETVNVALGLLRKGIGDIAFRCRRLSFAFHLINLRNLSESFWMCSSFFLEAEPWLLPWRSPEATKKWLKTNSGMLAGKSMCFLLSEVARAESCHHWFGTCFIYLDEKRIAKLTSIRCCESCDFWSDAKKAGNNAKRLSLCHFKGFKLQTFIDSQLERIWSFFSNTDCQPATVQDSNTWSVMKLATETGTYLGKALKWYWWHSCAFGSPATIAFSIKLSAEVRVERNSKSARPRVFAAWTNKIKQNQKKNRKLSNLQGHSPAPSLKWAIQEILKICLGLAHFMAKKNHGHSYRSRPGNS